jgi:prepilin-type N-terminal cleavage/methylation domain-containing protein
MLYSSPHPIRFRSGFTLIELLVVIAVILILVGIAVPNFINAIERANVTKAKVLVTELKSSVGAYNTDTRQWPLSGSEHLYAALGGLSPYSAKSSKKYNPPYMEFNAGNAGAETYAREYNQSTDIQIKQRPQSGSASSLKMNALRLSNPEVDVWRPLLDPWRRPIVYVSPDDLKKRFNDNTSNLDSSMLGLIAMDSEKAVNDKGNQANVPFGLSSGQIWSAGPDGITATADGRPAQSVANSTDKVRGLYQPGNLSGSDSRDNDDDGMSDASDRKGSGNSSAEDDINSWSN